MSSGRHPDVERGSPYTIAPVVQGDRYPKRLLKMLVSVRAGIGDAHRRHKESIMPTDTTETLAKLTSGQDDLKAGQAQIIGALGRQTEILRLLAEQLSLVLEKLAPQLGEGPTLQELLADGLIAGPRAWR
jgi:hypothetical protein